MFHRNTEKLESLVGAESTFRGDISTKGTIRIDGTVEGSVEADWVVLGEKANVKGDISARGVVIGGRVEGNLRVAEICEIRNKGEIYGEIATPKLTVAEGGVFDGKSTMKKEDAKVVDLFVKEKTS
ncbi:MAG: polymer-forming cytoskeletal protein [Nitrospiraceae bacterium]|nr:polymer-forming cytoskeletal protein [Nitrospiraceae bacterium]